MQGTAATPRRGEFFDGNPTSTQPGNFAILKSILMLPHFPKAHKEMRELRNEHMFDAMYSVSPVLSRIPTRPQREGKRSSFQDEQGVVRPIDYKSISIPVSRKAEEARGMTAEQFISFAREPGTAMGKEMMRGVFEILDKVTKETGNVVSGPISYNLFLDVWEKMQMDFNLDGTPIWPDIHLGSEAYAKFKTQLPEWLKDPAFHTRMKAIIERKREEFREREACRRLVD